MYNGFGSCALLLLMLAPGAAFAAPAETFGVEAPAAVPHKAARRLPSERLGVALAGVPALRLNALDRDALLREDLAARQSGEASAKGMRYGVGRALRLTAPDGQWYDLADGSRLWVGEIVAAEALGVRLHFGNAHLPAGSELAVSAPAEEIAGAFHNGSSRFDPEAQPQFFFSGQSTDFWTGSFFGDRVSVEYLAPAGSPSSLPFAIDALQHLYRDPVAELAKGLTAKAAGPCHNDVSCYPEWADVARAVSGIGFVNRDSLFCTGQLLDDQAHDLTPYWLTAHHCVNTAAKAQSAEVYWLYQTPACGGAPPSLGSVPHSVGATLLATNAGSDFSLLMVEGALPDGLFWAGWTSAQVANGTAAAAIHHPRGDYKRISFGFKDANAVCKNSYHDNPSLLRISWTDGPTESGSSGSGIFRADTHQLFGQLFDGPSACGRETYDCYGAFATTYPQIKGLLRGGTDDDSAPNAFCVHARAVSAGTLRNRIAKAGSPDWYRITVPAGGSVTVRLAFRNADGDLDLAAFRACGGAPAAVSAGTSDQETVTLANPAATPAVVSWRVMLASDTRNRYDMTVTVHQGVSRDTFHTEW
jgi:lysyl endopeptidase